jgi:hypothetical protein
MSPNFHRSWYDHNWDWALILLFALVLFAGIVLWTTYADRPQAAAIHQHLRWVPVRTGNGYLVSELGCENQRIIDEVLGGQIR